MSFGYYHIDIHNGIRTVLVLSAALLLGGCYNVYGPRMRIGSFYGDLSGMEFPEPAELGTHSRSLSLKEKNGMLYTCQGGFIDLGHMREAADRTEYLARITYQNLMQTDTRFSYRIIEPARYQVNVVYPDDWVSLPLSEKERIASEVSIRFGQYGAHTSLIWHEMLTWYGFASSGVFSENISSFSWEDPYSDVLGTCLAVEALRHTQYSYVDAMTYLIDATMLKLGVQPAHVAQEAARKIAGKWYTGGYYFFVDMKKRNFDVGLDDGMVTPWLVPGMCPNAVPHPCPAPTLDFAKNYGFRIELELRPLEFQKGKIFKALGGDKSGGVIHPAKDFPKILEQIKTEGSLLYGVEVDRPVLDEPVNL